MAVKGSKDGLNPSCNLNLTRVEPLVTLKTLKETFLFGVEVRNKQGELIPDRSLESFISNAVSWLEHFLDISITPVRDFVEDRDYYQNEYVDWGYFQLNNYPVIAVKKLEMVYYRDANGEALTFQTIPNNWLRLQPHDGILRLIPNARFPGNLQIAANGSFYPEIFQSSHVPHLWRITYDYGFCDGAIPSIINQVIGQLAALQAFIVGGHLVLGAGIASTSISLDGLSQSINTTQSAENSAFSATIRDYSDKLFGKRAEDPFSTLNILKSYYKGQNIALI